MAETKKFMFSVGNAGFEKYEVIDNISYVYTLNPKDEKEIPELINNIIKSTFVKVRSDYQEKADGFINIQTSWAPYKEGILVFHIYGDIAQEK